MLNFNKIKKLILSFILIFFTLTNIVAEAHNAYFIQSLIDDATMSYVGIIVYDKASFFNNEDKHYEAQLGDFTSMLGYSKPSQFNISSIKDKFKNGSQAQAGSGNNGMALTFPGIEDNSVGKNDAKREDEERAYFIKEILIPSLNNALYLLNNNQKFNSIDELVNMTQKLFNGGSVNGYSIQYGKRATNLENRIELPKGVNDSDVVTISKNVNGSLVEYEFIYRVPKGYKVISGRSKDAYPLANSSRPNYSKDADYVTWGHIAYEAVYAYYGHGFLLRTATEQVKPGVIERELIDFFSNIFSSLRNLLGLYDIDELVLNQGIRSGTTFYGVMPKPWYDKVKIFYSITQILAILVLLFAIVKLVFEKNLSTINTAMRVDMINRLQKLLVSGVVLSVLFPIVTLVVFKFNYLLVKVFNGASSGSISEAYKSISYQSGTFGSIIIQFAYFFIMIYLNFVYIVRAIIVSLLLATSPLFVASMALNNDTRLFNSWVKEMLANVYLQSVHALALSFFTTIGLSSRGIETLVVLGSLIPITNLFKQMVFGEAGGLVGILGEAGIQGAISTTMDAITGISSGLAYKEIKDRFDKNSNNEIKIKDSSVFGNNSISSEDGSIGVNDTGSISEKINSTRDAILNKPINLSNLKEEQNARNRIMNSIGNENTVEKGIVGKSIDVIKNNSDILKGVAQTGLGVGVAMAGLGTMVGTGNVKNGMGMVRSGVMMGALGISTMSDGISKISFNKNIEEPNLVEPTNEPSHEITSMIGAETLRNGDIAIYRSMDSLAQEGIDNITNNGDTYMYTYRAVVNPEAFLSKDAPIILKGIGTETPNGLSVQDQNNLIRYLEAKRNNDITFLRNNGIKDVTIDNLGRVQVHYNKLGIEKMGVSDVRTTNGGQRVVEIKKPYQQLSTYKTVTPGVNNSEN